MNHKAILLEWDRVGAMISDLQEKERWHDLAVVACAAFTGCRPGDWTRFTWSVFFNSDGTVKRETSIIESKPANIAKARAKKTQKVSKPKPRPIFILPQFRDILMACWVGMGSRDLSRYIFRGTSGPKSTRGGISTNTANTTMKRLAREYDLPDTITNYAFRKTCARRVYDSQDKHSDGLLLTQRFMNHKDSATTAHYIGLTDDETVSAFETLKF